MFHVSNHNVRVLDPPTHSRQFDANRGRFRYVSDPWHQIQIFGKTLKALFLAILGPFWPFRFYNITYHHAENMKKTCKWLLKIRKEQAESQTDIQRSFHRILRLRGFKKKWRSKFLMSHCSKLNDFMKKSRSSIRHFSEIVMWIENF